MHLLDHQTRRDVLVLLREGELTAGDISERLGRGRPTLSHHLSLLTEAGLIACRSQGAFRIYRIVPRPALAAWDKFLARSEKNEVGEIT